jgi:formylglycine-generating enzyme required for sulfatase activity
VEIARNSLRLVARLVFTSLALAAPSWAGIPEPDAIYYGTLRIDGVPQTASSAASIELRRGTQVLQAQTQLVQSTPEDLYVARLSLEAADGQGSCASCARVGERATVWVIDGASEHETALVEIGTRGRVTRQDLAAYTDPPDLDMDGVPDFRDNCVAFGSGGDQTDSDGDGIGDACEGLVDRPLSESFTQIGDVGNPPDPATGKGNVDYEFEVTSREVTNADYVEFLNAIAADDPHALYNPAMASDPRGGISRSGDPGAYAYGVKAMMAEKPVNFVSWLDAARYVNWLENGETQDPATTENGAFDLGVDEPERNAVLDEGASVSLPTENEWYKAAYYDPTSGGSEYWLYPTRSDQSPNAAQADEVGSVSNPGSNVANYASQAQWNGQTGSVTSVESADAPSFYGSHDQGGNVTEWLADGAEQTPEGFKRIVRGGSYASDDFALAATAGDPDREEVLRSPFLEDAETGLRVVRVGSGTGSGSDADEDGVEDADDNCVEVANASQSDPDQDGYGTACDADFNNDGVVGGPDFAQFVASFGSSAGDPEYDSSLDLNEDGGIGGPDYGAFLSRFGESPGPSGLACAGSIPCPAP